MGSVYIYIWGITKYDKISLLILVVSGSPTPPRVCQYLNVYSAFTFAVLAVIFWWLLMHHILCVTYTSCQCGVSCFFTLRPGSWIIHNSRWLCLGHQLSRVWVTPARAELWVTRWQSRVLGRPEDMTSKTLSRTSLCGSGHSVSLDDKSSILFLNHKPPGQRLDLYM